ncbi:MAG: DUF4097 domain-containing protein [bacterium]|nr:DUF4097 domain-containing protein [bacterium]
MTTPCSTVASSGRFLRLFAAIAMLAATAAAEEKPEQKPADPFGVPGFEVERVSWTGSVGDGEVVVVNRFGDVRGRFGGYEGEVEVFANVQQFESEGPRLEVETKETDAGVTVTVGYRDEKSGELVTTRDPAQKKRADMVVFVPKGAPVHVSTDQGKAQFKRLRSDVHATTVSGPISVREVQGHLNLTSGSGSILATLEPIDAKRAQSITTDSGDATIYVSEDASLTVRVATNGPLSTDYSMAIDYQDGRQPLKRGEAVVGKATEPMTLTTDSGHVRVVRRPSAHRARVQPKEGPPPSGPRPQAGAKDMVLDLRSALPTDESPVKVDTVTGDITVFAGPDTSATISFATSGEITVDYPVEIEFRHRQEPAKHGLVVIGDGAEQVRLRSRQGSVSVLRRPASEGPSEP